MKNRNFKIRISNLTLAKNVFLENSDDYSTLFIKYEKILTTLGYSVCSVNPSYARRNSGLGNGLKRYIFHPFHILQQRKKDYWLKTKISGSSRNPATRIRQAPRDTTFDVTLEIIQLNSKYNTK